MIAGILFYAHTHTQSHINTHCHTNPSSPNNAICLYKKAASSEDVVTVGRVVELKIRNQPQDVLMYVHGSMAGGRVPGRSGN